MSLSSGARLDHYEIRYLLGAGGMGEVYLAPRHALGRDVAIKLLPRGARARRGALRRFEQEARAASALNHPNIVTVHEIGDRRRRRFIAMEFVEGETLRDGWPRGRCTMPRRSTSRPDRRRSPPPTRPASSTATSSPRTSWSRATGS